MLGLLCTAAALRHVQEPLQKRPNGPERRRCAQLPEVVREEGKDLIVGGTIVDSGDKYPFLAWIGDKDLSGLMQFCGGTLIAPRIVLTAAHCTYTQQHKNANIYTKFRLADFKRDRGTARNVINWKRHAFYDADTMTNDIALLLLNESVPAEVAKPVKLSKGKGILDDEEEGERTIVGWGTTDTQCKNYDTYLREAVVHQGSGGGVACKTPGSWSLGKKDDFDGRKELCAGDFRGFHELHASCADSGGPLLAKHKGEWVQVGIDSWSYKPPYPEVYTRVSAYQDWIKETSAKLKAEGHHPMFSR